MKAVLQRVSHAQITVKSEIVSKIDNGLMILLGIKKGDDLANVTSLVDKCVQLRIFEDENGKFNLSIKDIHGEALVASQFTLLADTSRGRRPSFTEAEEPTKAKQLYKHFIDLMNEKGVPTKAGIFGERMEILLENNGPVTIILEE